MARLHPHGLLLCLVAWCATALAAAQAAEAVAITDDRGRRVELPAAPRRVVSLLPSLTEMVCALQHCQRLVGTDRFSNWPASVRALPKLGGLEDAQIERIVALKPDLVLAPASSRAIDRLEALGLRVLTLEPKSLSDTQRVIGLVAQALFDAPAGPALWQRIETRVDAAALRVPLAVRGQRVYFEVASAPYAAGEVSFIGEVLTRLGMANAVPAALGPFPKLNPEFVVRAQPDIVMATTRAVAEMAARPGWDTLRALRQQRHCGFDTERWDVLVRPGPRLADAADILVECLTSVAALPPVPR
ncbi:MAG: ABC transporter substrate-binding protein [Chitinophagaceae bacterium]|nr:ABC transporter substrate-binding protein [Rubrivivax sp.]